MSTVLHRVVPDAGSHSEADAQLWTAFSAAQGAGAFCQAWLALHCSREPRPRAAMLLLEDEEGSFAPAATWGANPEATAPSAEQALRDRAHCVQRTERGSLHAAYPVVARGRLWGVVAMDLGPVADEVADAALRQLHWGAGWLETLLHRREGGRDMARVEAARAALDLVGTAGAAPGTVGAASSLAGALASRLRCRRVAVGSVRRGRVRLIALSHVATPPRAASLSDGLLSAMEEALDAGGAVAFPALPTTGRRVTVAHRAHLRASGMGAVLSVPLAGKAGAVGVLTLEWDEAVALDAAALTLVEVVAELVGPVLALQRRGDRVLAGRLPGAIANGARALLGPRHPAVKLAAVAGVGALAYLCLVPGDYRVTGKAVLEGVVQRQAAAPFDGFVGSSRHRAGDVVEAGEVLATLDTRELELQAIRAEGQMLSARLRQQEADGKHDRAQAGIEAANAAEAGAELDLARAKIAQANIAAPFRGLVVSGDLSQMLGAPVERGKTLFEVAPLDQYRVAVQVDERDLGRVQPGQTGLLVLNALPGRSLPFTVDKVVPVSVPVEGRNTFRVEGTTDVADAALRPGLEGVGKVVVGQESLIRAWSHPAVDWVRLTAWKWLP